MSERVRVIFFHPGIMVMIHALSVARPTFTVKEAEHHKYVVPPVWLAGSQIRIQGHGWMAG